MTFGWCQLWSHKANAGENAEYRYHLCVRHWGFRRKLHLLLTVGDARRPCYLDLRRNSTRSDQSSLRKSLFLSTYRMQISYMNTILFFIIGSIVLLFIIFCLFRFLGHIMHLHAQMRLNQLRRTNDGDRLWNIFLFTFCFSSYLCSIS